MRLCLPTTDQGLLEARLSPHFGSAPCFTLVDTASGDIEVLVNQHAHHEHGKCNPTRGLEERGLDAVVCRGLGSRALTRLQGAGIPVLVTEAWTVADALAALQAGALRPMTDEEACGDGRGHGHHPGEGQGR